jgi:DNA helicase-2/ATP-dependent DNA helicase PcrA
VGDLPHDIHGARTVREVLFEITNETGLRAALARRARRAGRSPTVFAPMVRIGPQRLPRLPSSAQQNGLVPVWFWQSSLQELHEAAPELLREFVFPLTRSHAPFCLAFPFAANAFAAQPLTAATSGLLDLEDVGRLLAAASRGTSEPCRQSVAGRPASPQRRGSTRATSVTLQTDLDPLQTQAVHYGGAALRVLAPAGSGKTKTMINRVAALVAGGAPPGSILVLAFNTLAAEQLEERLSGLGVPTTRRIDDRTGVHCATFNAFGYRYQRQVMGVAPPVDDSAALRERLMRASVWSALARSSGPPPQRGSAAAALDDLVWRALDALAAARADLCDPHSVTLPVPPLLAEGAASLPFASVMQRFARMQRRHGRQSFDDQVTTAVCDLLTHPSRRHALQDCYRHLLVDEFQDLNAAQLALVDIVSRPCRSLFVVGDDDQLIYGWRFARLENILSFPQRMPAPPHCQTIVLRTNYRCSPEIVRRASKLISVNTRRAPKQIGCRPGAPAGAVMLYASPDWRARAATLSAFLADVRTATGCAWHELAVLCRYRAQLLAVAAALDALKVPRGELPATGLFSSPAARLLADCLALVADPFPQQPTATTRHLASALNLTAPQLLARARNLRLALGNHHFTAQQALDLLLEELPIEAAAARKHRLRPDDRGAAEDGGPATVLEAARLLSLDHRSLAAFHRVWHGWAAAEGVVPPKAGGTPPAEQTRDAVVLSTIHAAKGREYAAVAIADYAADLAALNQEAIEEERRVLYVALTRAAHSVLLTVDTHKHAPHQFLRELADPPSTQQTRQLRRELAELQSEEAPSSEAQSAQSTTLAARQAAELRLRRLQVESRLIERRLFGQRGRLQRALATVGLGSDR